jgi:hypothetical protein
MALVEKCSQKKQIFGNEPDQHVIVDQCCIRADNTDIEKYRLLGCVRRLAIVSTLHASAAVY